MRVSEAVIDCCTEGAAATIRAAALEAEAAQLKAALAEKDALLQGLAAQVPTLQARQPLGAT